MGYARLDEFRGTSKNASFPLIIAVSAVMIVLGAIIGAFELVDYSDEYNNVSQTFGNDVIIGGVQVGGLNEADRLALLESVYVEQPILLRYGDSPIIITPQQVGFRLDTAAMEAAANIQLEGDYWGGFWKFLWRQDPKAINIPIYADYDNADIRAFLESIAVRYDTISSAGGFDQNTGSFITAGSGTTLDINASIPLIEQAFFSLEPEGRVIDLPTTSFEGAPPTMQDLENAIIQYLSSESRIQWNGPDGVVSVYILNLDTGEEIGINEYILHDGTSTIKIGILLNFFRNRISEPDALQARQLANAVICSDNGDANNLMLATSSDGSYIDGIRRASDTMCLAGGVHTQIMSNLGIGSIEDSNLPSNYYTIIQPNTCEGRANLSLDTHIDTGASQLVQTTAADMGTIMMNIYDCAMYGSGAATIFEGEVTQNECRQLVEVFRGTNFLNMGELGVPDSVDLAHKVGYVDDTSSDVGVVMSEGGNYIYSIYIWDRDGRGDGSGLFDSRKWDIFGNITRIAYNYFNPETPQLQTERPPIDGVGAYCVMPRQGYEINLYDINENRFDANGNPDPIAGCYGWPDCLPFDNWGLDP